MTHSPFTFLLSLPIWVYRKLLSPLKPPTCRFQPTCSAYALQALQLHGALRGSWLTMRRICRCHPFCKEGWDPVPAPKKAATPCDAPESDPPPH